MTKEQRLLTDPLPALIQKNPFCQETASWSVYFNEMSSN